MCARFNLTASGDELAEAFALDAVPRLVPRYNIAPSQPVAVVRHGAPRRTLGTMRWGLVPPWSVELGGGLINARAETAHERPAFRDAFRERRCLVPAQGFYEWKKVGGERQPYLFRRADGAVMAFAGLFEAWRSPAGELVETCTILTTEPNALVAALHDRMPVILPPAAYARWLEPGTVEPAALQDLLAPCDPVLMAAHPVTRRLNRPDQDDPSCIEPAYDEEAKIPRQGTLF